MQVFSISKYAFAVILAETLPIFMLEGEAVPGTPQRKQRMGYLVQTKTITNGHLSLPAHATASSTPPSAPPIGSLTPLVMQWLLSQLTAMPSQFATPNNPPHNMAHSTGGTPYTLQGFIAFEGDAQWSCISDERLLQAQQSQGVQLALLRAPAQGPAQGSSNKHLQSDTHLSHSSQQQALPASCVPRQMRVPPLQQHATAKESSHETQQAAVYSPCTVILSLWGLVFLLGAVAALKGGWI